MVYSEFMKEWQQNLEQRTKLYIILFSIENKQVKCIKYPFKASHIGEFKGPAEAELLRNFKSIFAINFIRCCVMYFRLRSFVIYNIFLLYYNGILIILSAYYIITLY